METDLRDIESRRKTDREKEKEALRNLERVSYFCYCSAMSISLEL